MRSPLRKQKVEEAQYRNQVENHKESRDQKRKKRTRKTMTTMMMILLSLKNVVEQVSSDLKVVAFLPVVVGGGGAVTTLSSLHWSWLAQLEADEEFVPGNQSVILSSSDSDPGDVEVMRRRRRTRMMMRMMRMKRKQGANQKDKGVAEMHAQSDKLQAIQWIHSAFEETISVLSKAGMNLWMLLTIVRVWKIEMMKWMRYEKQKVSWMVMSVVAVTYKWCKIMTIQRQSQQRKMTMKSLSSLESMSCSSSL